MLPILGPLAKLAYSRKALIGTVDALCSVGAILVTRYFYPADTTMTLAIIAVLQPMVIMWINSIATEDAAGKTAAGVWAGRATEIPLVLK